MNKEQNTINWDLIKSVETVLVAHYYPRIDVLETEINSDVELFNLVYNLSDDEKSKLVDLLIKRYNIEPDLTIERAETILENLIEKEIKLAETMDDFDYWRDDAIYTYCKSLLSKKRRQYKSKLDQLDYLAPDYYQQVNALRNDFDRFEAWVETEIDTLVPNHRFLS